MRALLNRITGWGWAFIVLGVVALVVVFVLLAFPSKASEQDGTSSNTTPTPSSSSAQSDPEGSLVDEHGHDHDESEIPIIAENDCRNFMSQADYDSFMKRLYDFEVVSNMPASDGRLELMVPFVTDVFLASQTGFTPEYSEKDVYARVDRESASGCTWESETVVIGRIVPVVSINRVLSDGSEEVLQGPLKLQSHYTRWIQIDGSWYVDQELQ